MPDKKAYIAPEIESISIDKTESLASNICIPPGSIPDVDKCDAPSLTMQQEAPLS